MVLSTTQSLKLKLLHACRHTEYHEDKPALSETQTGDTRDTLYAHYSTTITRYHTCIYTDFNTEFQ